MQTVIDREYRKKCINYIQPIKQIAEDIYDHRISYESFQHLYNKVKSLHGNSYTYIVTRFYSQDVILLQNMKNTQYCFMQPIQYIHDIHPFRFVRRINIPLSVTRFNPSYEFDHIDQVLIIGFTINNIDIQFELIYSNIKAFNERNITDLSADLFKSISYKIYLTSKTEIQTYLDLLK